MPDTTGITSGTFAIPNTGETASNVWYRVYLTVTDSGGLSTTTSRDVLPNTVVISLATNPPGLRVTLDGQPVTTPMNVTSVVGIIRTLGVVSPQVSGNTTYQFASWSDGGAATHTVATPGTNRTYTASYVSILTTPTGLASREVGLKQKERNVRGRSALESVRAAQFVSYWMIVDGATGGSGITPPVVFCQMDPSRASAKER